MEHQRHAHGLEGRAGQLGPVLGGRGRQPGPAHVRKPDAGTLEHRAAFQDAGHPLALQGLVRHLVPAVLDEALPPVEGLDGGGDALLQRLQVLAHGLLER